MFKYSTITDMSVLLIMESARMLLIVWRDMTVKLLQGVHKKVKMSFVARKVINTINNSKLLETVVQ